MTFPAAFALLFDRVAAFFDVIAEFKELLSAFNPLVIGAVFKSFFAVFQVVLEIAALLFKLVANFLIFAEVFGFRAPIVEFRKQSSGSIFVLVFNSVEQFGGNSVHFRAAFFGLAFLFSVAIFLLIHFVFIVAFLHFSAIFLFALAVCSSAVLFEAADHLTNPFVSFLSASKRAFVLSGAVLEFRIAVFSASLLEAAAHFLDPLVSALQAPDGALVLFAAFFHHFLEIAAAGLFHRAAGLSAEHGAVSEVGVLHWAVSEGVLHWAVSPSGISRVPPRVSPGSGGGAALHVGSTVLR